nr:MAG TPA: Large subunit terminase [Caudoviricetes sp.]
MTSPLLEKQMQRWYPLKEHPVQIALLDAVKNGIRFPLVPAGRRSGKTERAKRFVAAEAMQNPGGIYFCAAPTRPQAEKIFWRDMKDLTLTEIHPRQPLEGKLIIYLPNGSEIHVLGLDAPERFEGIPWTGGVIDEIADVKSDAIWANIMPALNTFNPSKPDYRPWCWFTGVPDGLNHYYEMCQMAESGKDPNYAVYHWKSEDILPADVIESAKRTMSAKQYAQEYCASFETATGKIYEDYSKDNYTTETIQPHEAIHWSHDQNYTPLSSCIAVVRNDTLYLLDEIILESAVSRQSAEEFVEKYRNHTNKLCYLYGDPAGRAGEKHGHNSDYTDIEQVLRSNGWRVERRVASAHPAIKDRQNTVRALIKNALGEIKLFVNPNTAQWCHKGLATVQLQAGSSFQEDQRNQYQHITTAIGYMAHRLWPQGVTKPREIQSVGVIA